MSWNYIHTPSHSAAFITCRGGSLLRCDDWFTCSSSYVALVSSVTAKQEMSRHGLGTRGR